MKKISVLFIIFLLMISLFSVCSQKVIATEEQDSTVIEEQVSNTDDTQATETETGSDEGNSEYISEDDTINTYGKIVEVGEVKENVTEALTEKVQPVVIEIIEGDYIGEEFSAEYVLSYDIEGKILAQELDVGDKVTVQISEDATGNTSATIVDIVRSNYIIGVFVLFLISIVIIGGKKGIRVILGVLYAIILIYLVLVKGIYNGTNAIKLSILTCALVTFGIIAIIFGMNKRTFSAVLGTLGGVLITGIVTVIFNNATKLTGAYEEAIQLSIDTSLNFRYILLGGILIATVGICMDIGMTIVSSLNALKMKNPDITWKELFKSGMQKGKEIIGTKSIILILAYFGSSLTTIILLLASDMSMYEILNKESIAEEIITAFAGSIGTIYAIPITSFMYSILNKDRVIYSKTSENKINGKRSLKI